MGFGKQLGIVLEDLREMMGNHRSAGAGRHEDVLGAAKDIQKVPGDLARFVCVAGVEGGLAAAGLRFWEINLVAQPFQNLCDGDADLGKNLIDDAGNE